MSIHETFINIHICRPDCPCDFEETDHEQCSLHIHPDTAPTHYQVLQLQKCQCLYLKCSDHKVALYQSISTHFSFSHLAQVFVQEFIDMVVQVYLTVLLVLASL